MFPHVKNNFIFSDPKIVFDNFSDPSGGSGSILDSVKMNSTQLTPEQELAKSQQSRKGIQTSPDGMQVYLIL